jgi:hypothetical protein
VPLLLPPLPLLLPLLHLLPPLAAAAALAFDAAAAASVFWRRIFCGRCVWLLSGL